VYLAILSNFGAGNETRTRDPDLGKVVLYQLSYSRLGDAGACILRYFSNFGAGNETRTRDPDLGKVVLYQLSYSRKSVAVVTEKTLSLREAHYTRNRMSCNPPVSDFFEIQFKCWNIRHIDYFYTKPPTNQARQANAAGQNTYSLMKFSR
jgi:hypothetical protein